jgi:hypothetical protein
MSSFLQATRNKTKAPPKQQKVVKNLSRIIPETSLNFRVEDYPDKREVWTCPFGIKCKLMEKPVQERMWRVPKSGFTNLYSHMASCCDGGEEGLLRMFDEAVERAKDAGVEPNPEGNILQYFVVSNVSEKSRQLHGWLKWITEKNMPLTAIQDPAHRAFSKFTYPFSYQTGVNVLNKLVELVEKKIKEELNTVKAAGGKAAIIYDGWTSRRNEHYVGLFISYLRPTEGRTQGQTTTFWVPEIALLACSPMNRHNDDDEGDAMVAINFNAEQHVEFIQYTLDEYYDIDLSIHTPGGFITNQITDNASVNLRIGRLLGIPTVGCLNHRFNLEMEHYVVHNCLELVESVHATMVSISSSLKLTSHLKRHSQLVPIFFNDTRWYGKFFMLKRWLELYPHIIAVNSEVTAKDGRRGRLIFMDPHLRRSDVETYAKYFEKFHNTHTAMEARGMTLSGCRAQLDAWVLVMNTELPVNHELHGCHLGMTYIRRDANIIDYEDFENGVVKIQTGEAHLLTDPERVAVSSLRRNAPAIPAVNVDQDTDIDPTQWSSPRKIAKEIHRKRQKLQESAAANEYIRCDYILGSVAEVERLWSLARHVLTYDRMSTSPRHVEGLLFLKVNSRFWDESTVEEARLALSREES